MIEGEYIDSSGRLCKDLKNPLLPPPSPQSRKRNIYSHILLHKRKPNNRREKGRILQ